MEQQEKKDPKDSVNIPKREEPKQELGGIMVGPEVKEPSAYAESVLLDTTPAKNNFPKFKVVLISIIGLLLTGAASYAFYANLITLPFGRISNEEILAKMFERLNDLQSADYSANFKFKTERRQSGTDSVDLSARVAMSGGEGAEGLERDVKKNNAIREIASLLSAYKASNGAFPLLLENVISDGNADLIKDPKTGEQYGYRQENEGKDYTLHVTMETEKGYSQYLAQTASAKKNDTKLAEIHSDTILVKKSVLYQNLPSDIDASLTVSGFGSLDPAISGSKSELDGNVKMGGMSLSGNLEALSKDGMAYFQIKEGPSLPFFDFAALKGKWVKFDTAVAGDKIFLDYLGLQGLQNGEKPANLSKIIKSLIKIAKEEQVFEVTDVLSKEKGGTGRLHHLKAKAKKEKLDTLTKRFQTEAGLKIPAFLGSNTNREEEIELEFWIDTKTYLPVKIVSVSTFAPPDDVEKMKEKQYRSEIIFELKETNKPVMITPPVESISMDEAAKLITGK